MKSILIVDDLEDWRQTLTYVLTDEGFKCSTASSVTEAIYSLENNKFDFAILDIRLSEQDESDVGGLDILKWIDSNAYKVKVILFSGYMTREIVNYAFINSKSAIDCLVKTNVSELLTVLTNP